ALSSIHYPQSAISNSLFSKLHLLMIHGENDEIFPVADYRRMAETLMANGVVVDLRIFPGQSHNFGADRSVIVRGVAEYCARFFDTDFDNKRNTKGRSGFAGTLSPREERAGIELERGVADSDFSEKLNAS